MSKNDPTGKQHQNFTKTTSQPTRHGTYSANESHSAGTDGSIDIPTPYKFLTGLSGINRAANKSDITNFGKVGPRTKKVPAERPGTDGSISLKPSPSDETNFGH